MTWDPAKHPRGPGGRFGHGSAKRKAAGVEAITGGAPSAFAGARGEDHVPRTPSAPTKTTRARAPKSTLTAREMFGESAFGRPAKAPTKKAPAKKAPAKTAEHNPLAGSNSSGFALIAEHAAQHGQPLVTKPSAPTAPLPKIKGFRPPKKSSVNPLAGSNATGFAQIAAAEEARLKAKKKSARSLMKG